MTDARRRHFTMATLALVNFLWAAQYPAYKIASQHMSAATMNFWTLLFGITLLAPFLRRQASMAKRVQSPAPWTRTAAQFVLLGVFGIVPPSVMLAWGIARSTASNAAILSLTIPVLMTAMGIVVLGEKITTLRLASLAMALAGTLVISRSDLSGELFRPGLLAGNAVILIAGLGSAFYNVYAKVLLERFSEIEVLVGSYSVGAACCLLASLIWDAQPFYRVTSFPPAAWLSVAILGAFTWGIAMVLWMWVLKRLEAGQVSVSIYLLSFFGVVLSALTLRERLGLPQMAGGALVVVATYLTSEYENRRSAGRNVDFPDRVLNPEERTPL